MAAVRVSASKDAVAEVEEQYLSVCLDLGQIAEPTRFWNPAAGQTQYLQVLPASVALQIPRKNLTCLAAVSKCSRYPRYLSHGTLIAGWFTVFASARVPARFPGNPVRYR